MSNSLLLGIYFNVFLFFILHPNWGENIISELLFTAGLQSSYLSFKNVLDYQGNVPVVC